MKNIFYCSSVQTQLFKFNTRSNFKNYIDINKLDYLPEGEIEVPNKEITLTELWAAPQIGLKSKLS